MKSVEVVFILTQPFLRYLSIYVGLAVAIRNFTKVIFLQVQNVCVPVGLSNSMGKITAWRLTTCPTSKLAPKPLMVSSFQLVDQLPPKNAILLELPILQDLLENFPCCTHLTVEDPMTRFPVNFHL